MRAADAQVAAYPLFRQKGFFAPSKGYLTPLL
jgi:hypothetical protein